MRNGLVFHLPKKRGRKTMRNFSLKRMFTAFATGTATGITTVAATNNLLAGVLTGGVATGVVLAFNPGMKRSRRF
jgi:hypothetical protein